MLAAVRRGNAAGVSALLRAGAQAAGAGNGAALEAAAERENVAVLEQLLEALPRLPPPHAADQQPVAGGQLPATLDRALMAAVRRGNAAGVSALLRAGAQAAGAEGSRALRLAVGQRNVAMAAKLLAGGASAASEDGTAAVVLAARQGNSGLLDLLLQAGGDPDADDGQPLITSARNGDEGVLRVLLARGADPRRRQDKALELAATNGHQSFVHRLLGAGVPAAAAASRRWLDEVVMRAHVGVLLVLRAYGLVVPPRTAALAAKLGNKEVLAVLK